MKSFTVKTAVQSEVIIEKNFSGLLGAIKKIFRGKKIVILCDDNTMLLFFSAVKDNLPSATVCPVYVNAGEKSKSIETYAKVIQDLSKYGVTRNDLLIALGGGVIGDLGGFVASTYLRGIDLIQCPTTLLSMVDSSIGGKTALNTNSGKNLIGTFYQPKLTYIALCALDLLPERELKSGMGEIVKCALLSNEITLEDIESGRYEDLIMKCLRLKANLVEKDERDEKGERIILNLGHTFGHAMEKLSDFSISHGECVAMGILPIIDLSAAVFGLSTETVTEMKEVLYAAKINLNRTFDRAELLKNIAFDKKNDGEKINFVLLKGKGKPCVLPLTIAEVKEALRW